MQQQAHEPKGIQGRRVVLVFFLILAVISIVSYFSFKFLLEIPAA